MRFQICNVLDINSFKLRTVEFNISSIVNAHSRAARRPKSHFSPPRPTPQSGTSYQNARYSTGCMHEGARQDRGRSHKGASANKKGTIATRPPPESRPNRSSASSAPYAQTPRTNSRKSPQFASENVNAPACRMWPPSALDRPESHANNQRLSPAPGSSSPASGRLHFFAHSAFRPSGSMRTTTSHFLRASPADSVHAISTNLLQVAPSSSGAAKPQLN